jgi:hypothetical protein
MPPPIAGASFSSLGISVTTASVVVIKDDTLNTESEKQDLTQLLNDKYQSQHKQTVGSLILPCGINQSSPNYFHRVNYSRFDHINIFICSCNF